MGDRNTGIRGDQIKDLTVDTADIKANAITGAKLNANIVDDFTMKLSNNKLKIADRIELNTMLNAFRIAINGSLSIFNMVDGITDEYEDESGIDTVNSLNEDYDSTNDLYKPTLTANLELDYMEYATDGAAQAAYVTSGGDISVVVSSFDGNKSPTTDLYPAPSAADSGGQEFQLGETITCNKAEIHMFRGATSTGNLVCRIETDSSGLPSGTLVHANATKTINASSVPVSPGGWVEFAFASSFTLNSGTVYHLTLRFEGSGSKLDMARDNTQSPNGNAEAGTPGSWSNVTTSDHNYKLYKISKELQCYSESSIKNQGNYSLKVVAAITDSLNDTLTKSGLSIDLSGRDELKIDFYASRTGTNIQLKIHDSGGTTSTKNITISSAGTWETTTWDISGIDDVDKDNIDSIIIEIIEASVANTFYVDNFYAPGQTNNMTLISNSETAEVEPDTARIVIFEEDVDSITLQTDLKAYITKDGGSTYAQVTLSDEGDYQSGKRILTGIVDLTQSGIGSGTSMEYKITTLNNKSLKLHGVGLLWD